MNLSTLSGNRMLRIVIVVIGISLLAGLAAIFVLKVDPYTVLSFGLLGLFMASHLFMHGGHGGHEDHSQHTQPADHTTEAAPKADQTNKQMEHTGRHT